MVIVEFIMWVSWAILFLIPQDRIPIHPLAGLFAGLFLFMIGITLMVKAMRALEGFKDPGKLVTDGIYGMIRHPMYLGWMLILLSFPLVFRAAWAFATSMLLSIIIIIWAYADERKLELKYENKYRAYKKKVGMFLPKMRF
jgi:protein-S-isoprenylcysteine O-methyltransferase Ste14